MDGAAEASSPKTGEFTRADSANWVQVGRYGTGARLRGAVDCSIIYTRALSPAEIALHHLMLSSPATWASAGELVAVGGAMIAPRRPQMRRMGPRTILSGVI